MKKLIRSLFYIVPITALVFFFVLFASFSLTAIFNDFSVAPWNLSDDPGTTPCSYPRGGLAETPEERIRCHSFNAQYPKFMGVAIGGLMAVVFIGNILYALRCWAFNKEY